MWSHQEETRTQPLLVTRYDAAELLGVSLQEVNRLICSGHLRTHLVGERRGKTMVFTSSILEFGKGRHGTTA